MRQLSKYLCLSTISNLDWMPFVWDHLAISWRMPCHETSWNVLLASSTVHECEKVVISWNISKLSFLQRPLRDVFVCELQTLLNAA